jgi:hypothetical protein
VARVRDRFPDGGADGANPPKIRVIRFVRARERRSIDMAMRLQLR